jgi:hypothetical protein
MKSQQVRTEWGVEGRGENEKKREQQNIGVRDGVLDRNRYGVGQK